MCECESAAMDAYHAQVIVDLAERLREAEATRDDNSLSDFGYILSLRGELRSYGRSVAILKRIGVLDA